MNFRLGRWLVYPGLNTVGVGERSTHITPKSMQVLAFLAKRQGEAVPKEEIFQEVWPGTSVSDDALTRCIGELRRAFDDDSKNPTIIQTIPKRGYLLLPPVSWEPGPEVQAGPVSSYPPTRRRFLYAAGAIAIPAAVAGWRWLSLRQPFPALHRIAVLPLADFSAPPVQEYFADAMTEELITALARIGGWQVISRTSTMRYKGSKQPVRQIAGELAVDGVIEGAVMRSADRVRITLQFVHAATDSHLWAGEFEGSFTEGLALQSRIARETASELRMTLRPHESARLNRAPKVSPEAYEAYLKGRYYLGRSRFREASSNFRRAAAIEPGFALAHVLFAEAEGMISFHRDEPPGEDVFRAVETARRLDENLAEVHMAFGDRKFYGEWDWAAGEAEFRRAVELDPGSVDAVGHYAGCLHALRRWQESLREHRRALQLDPMSPSLNANFIGMLTDSGQYDAALTQFRKTVELDTRHPPYGAAGLMFEMWGKPAEAIANYLKADELSGMPADDLAALAQAARTGGLRGYWRQRLERLRAKARREQVRPLQFAYVYARLDERDAAMEMLETAWREHAGQLVWIYARENGPIRSDSRFQALLRRMRFPE
jgi:TolB-like protein/DNA-binding winged helix-turn-helix (wHTH) protein/Tfp pilus assembly protein PilF